MLKHEIPSETPLAPAAQVRVTPEELAAAITALQIRKEGQPGTIAIGDAVDELGLDVTSEEVLAEVQARRSKPKSVCDFRALACAFACLALFAGVESVVASHHYVTPKTALTIAPEFVQPDTLSKVGDEQQVYVDSHGLKQIIEGVPEAKVSVYITREAARWGLIKHSGKVYVQAYTFKTTEQGLKSKSIKLFSSEHANDSGFEAGAVFEDNRVHSDVKVTLPVQALRYQDSQQVDGISKVLVKEVTPDNHVWDGF